MIRTLLITLATTLSFYRQNPPQALFVLVGLVLGCGLFTSVAQINASAKASYSEADQILGATAQLRITDREETEIAVDDYIAFRRSGFTSVYPVIEANLLSKENDLVSLISTDLLSLPLTDFTGDRADDNPFAGDSWSKLIQPPYEVWVPPQTARRLGVVEGDQIELRNGVFLPPAKLRTQPQQNDRIFVDVGAALDLLETDRFSYLATSALTASERKRFTELFGEQFVLSANSDELDLSQITQSLHTNLTALGLLSFVVGIFIVFNAVYFSLHARQQTLAVLRDLGTPHWCIVVSIIVEALIWSLIGSLVGMLIAQPLSAALMPAVASTVQNIYGASVSSVPLLNGKLLLQAFGLAVAGMCLALALPLWRASTRQTGSIVVVDGLPPLRVSGVAVLLGFVMLLTAIVIYPHTSTLIQGFGLLSLVLFAGVVLLSDLIVLVVASGRVWVARSWLGRWVLADVLRQLPHLRLAMMALLLTLVANIGVTSLVGSFRLALTDWLETRLSADLFVDANALNVSQLRDKTWVSAVHQRTVIDIEFSGRKAEIIGVSVESPDFLETNIIDPMPNAYARWAQRNGDKELIFANEQVRYLAGIESGETITLQTTLGPRQFVVGGFFHDYGNVNFTFHIRRNLFDELFPNGSVQGWSIWVEPGRLKDAELDLAKMDLDSTDWISQRDVLDLSMTIFDRTFAITRALNTLTLLIAAIAIFASLLAVYQFRRNEYALWRALGTQWTQFFWITGSPVLLMTAIVMVLALPLGIALSWLLIHKINVISFGWTMSVAVSPSAISITFGLIICVVLTAFALASFGQRSAVNESLKELAGE